MMEFDPHKFDFSVEESFEAAAVLVSPSTFFQETAFVQESSEYFVSS